MFCHTAGPSVPGRQTLLPVLGHSLQNSIPFLLNQIINHTFLPGPLLPSIFPFITSFISPSPLITCHMVFSFYFFELLSQLSGRPTERYLRRAGGYLWRAGFQLRRVEGNLRPDRGNHRRAGGAGGNLRRQEGSEAYLVTPPVWSVRGARCGPVGSD